MAMGASVVMALLWVVLGVGVAVLAYAARLRPAVPLWRGRRGLLTLCLLGAGSALVGGLFATLLLGKLFDTATALWVAVLAVTLVPRLAPWPRLRTPTPPRS